MLESIPFLVYLLIHGGDKSSTLTLNLTTDQIRCELSPAIQVILNFQKLQCSMFNSSFLSNTASQLVFHIFPWNEFHFGASHVVNDVERRLRECISLSRYYKPTVNLSFKIQIQRTSGEKDFEKLFKFYITVDASLT